MTITGILAILLAAWGPVNEIIANVPALKSNSALHMVLNVIGSLIGAIKPKV